MRPVSWQTRCVCCRPNRASASNSQDGQSLRLGWVCHQTSHNRRHSFARDKRPVSSRRRVWNTGTQACPFAWPSRFVRLCPRLARRRETATHRQSRTRLAVPSPHCSEKSIRPRSIFVPKPCLSATTHANRCFAHGQSLAARAFAPPPMLLNRAKTPQAWPSRCPKMSCVSPFIMSGCCSKRRLSVACKCVATCFHSQQAACKPWCGLQAA